MSDHEAPDHTPNQHPEEAALAELARLVRHLGEELAGYRKRALSAEARLKALDDMAAKTGANPERSFALEHENAELKARLDEARARTKKMLERIRFLRHQQEAS